MEEDPMYLLGFNLLRVDIYHSLYMKVVFDKERVGFMIQERGILQEEICVYECKLEGMLLLIHLCH
jgi:hypothetical protein